MLGIYEKIRLLVRGGLREEPKAVATGTSCRQPFLHLQLGADVDTALSFKSEACRVLCTLIKSFPS